MLDAHIIAFKDLGPTQKNEHVLTRFMIHTVRDFGCI